MNRFSYADQAELLLLAALLTADYSTKRQGFRQRDLKFYLELFQNWTESPYHPQELSIQNVQIKRFLKDLSEQGLIIEKRVGNNPVYRPNRAGLLQIVKNFIEKSYFTAPDQIFFVIYFIKSYRDRIVSLIANEGKDFPQAIKIELEALLDVNGFINEQIKNIDRYLKQLAIRIEENQNAAKLIAEMESKGKEISTILMAIENTYPYQLNNQKSLSELLSKLSPAIQLEELKDLGLQRSQTIWQQQQALYQNIRTQLVSLCEQS